MEKPRVTLGKRGSWTSQASRTRAGVDGRSQGKALAKMELRDSLSEEREALEGVDVSFGSFSLRQRK
jgi:hypothetical protein